MASPSHDEESQYSGASSSGSVQSSSKTEDRDHVMYPSEQQVLGQTFLRIYWIFQAVVVGPISAALAISAFVRLVNTHGSVYDVVTDLCCAILSAGILFIVLFQRNVTGTKALTFKFEAVKSGLATALWLWLMLDAAFAPQSQYAYYKRESRVISAAVSFVVLPILFYPTLFYAAHDKRRGAIFLTGYETDETAERLPLLQA